MTQPFHECRPYSRQETRTGGFDQAIDLMMLLAFIWYLTPVEFIVPIPLLLGSRLITWLLLLIFSAFAVRLLFRFSSMTRWTVVSLFAFINMTILGVLRFGLHFETAVFGNDMLTFFALVAGLIWASTRSQARLLSAFRIIATLSTMALVVTIVGLRIGFITPMFGEERLSTQSMYTCTFAVASLLPVGLVQPPGERRELSSARLALFAAGLASVFAAGVLSAGRTVTLQGLGALAVSAVPIFTQRRSKTTSAILVVGALIGIGAVISVFVETSTQADLLRERVVSTSTTDGGRFEELVALLDQVSSSLMTGWGFGSLFDSPIPIEEYGLAAAPHIGVFTYLQKGGVLIFGIFVLVPIYICFRGLFRSASNTIAYGAAGALVVYLITGFTSGGWFTVQVFIFGACLSVATYGKNSTGLRSRNRYTVHAASSFEEVRHEVSL